MSSDIRIKRRGADQNLTGGAPGSLLAGELAVDLVNQILYSSNNTTVMEIARNTADNGLLLKDAGGNTVTVTAVGLNAASYTLILPEDNGSSGEILTSGGAGSPLQWSSPGGGGNVSNSGTPVDNQLAVWTNSSTIEGDDQLTFDTTTNLLTAGNVAVSAVASGQVVYGTTGGRLISEGAFAYNDSTNTLTADNINASGGGVTTAVTDTQMMFSASGVITGDSGFTYNSGTDTLSVVNVAVAGDLTVSGTFTTLDVETVAIQDPIIKIANNNVTDGSVDIGLYGRYGPALWSGLFRDASDTAGPNGTRVWKLWTDLTSEPTTAFNIGSGELAQLDAVVDGGTY